ncbi:MAG: formate dehydrogenase accessory sulfurtransferase FdhD [Pseudomonadota bacterium]
MTTPAKSPFLIAPDIDDGRLTKSVAGLDENGEPITVDVVTERPLTLFLNAQEIVTMMTIGDHPALLAVGYLRNQNMVRDDDVITGVEHDEELGVVIVRTQRETDYEAVTRKRVRTSGCAQGTVFADVMDGFDAVVLPSKTSVSTTQLIALSKTINTTPSLYLKAGAIHGCVLAMPDRPLVYMEDVGRHNAVDKIAGWMHLGGADGTDKLLYTTGRLTSEMVIKTVMMGIPILVSRSGFTAWGVELAQQAGLTLIGRARGKKFTVLSGDERVIRDHAIADISDASEDPATIRKGARDVG